MVENIVAESLNLEMSVNFGGSGVNLIEEWGLLDIESFTVSSKVNGNKNNLWNIESTLSGTELHFEPTEPEGTLSIDQFEIKSSLVDVEFDPFHRKLDSETFIEMLDDVDADNQWLVSLLSSQPGERKAHFNVALRDLLIERESLNVLGVGEFKFGTSLEEADEIVNLSITTTVAETKIEQSVLSQLKIPLNLVPETLTLDIALSKFPARRMAELFLDAENPDYMSGVDRDVIREKLITELEAFGTLLEFRDFRISAPSLEILVDGKFQVDSNNDFGVSGYIVAHVEGIDKIKTWAVEQQILDLIAFISMVQGFGEPVQTEDKDTLSYSYKFILSSDGSATLNNIPLDALQ